MKKQMMIAALLAVGLASHTATAAVINFDGTAPAGSLTVFGTNGSYTEQGFTLTATGGTELYSISGTFGGGYFPSYNNTDFGYFQVGAKSVNLSATTPFSLQSFAEADFSTDAGTLTLTGNLAGGGTLTQVFNTLGTKQWSLFTLGSSWTNLSSVGIVASSGSVGLDSFTVNETSAVPIPAAVWLFGPGIAGLIGASKRKKAAIA